MIPRKLAKRLLEEYAERLQRVHADALVAALDDPDQPSGDRVVELDLAEVASALLASSDLVLRGAENVEQKARRYLTEGRVVVERITGAGLIVASARGSAGETYALGYDPVRAQWRCTCPVKRSQRCSHLAALQLIVRRPQ